jgi:RNA polymerase sigma-70 factor (ECF subfamily)
METNIESDEQVVKKVQAGDDNAFGLLVERYEAKLSRYARKFLFGYDDGQDMLQEVFLKAYTNIQSFDVKRNFSSWIYRIAHNEFINAIKKKGREPLNFFDPDTIFPHPTSKDNPVRETNRTETIEEMNLCLDKLDPKYREPLVLYYIEDLDYQRISEILQIPVSTVGVRLNRGREILKKNYINKYGHEHK